jgi:glutamate/tyrosine decarboxylase-like PLP-dependent enzyme
MEPALIGWNIVCFRFNPGGWMTSFSNTEKEILMQLQEKGIAAPSYTTLHGQYCLRLAIVNHRSEQDDFDVLAKEVVRIGRELTTQFHKGV